MPQPGMPSVVPGMSPYYPSANPYPPYPSYPPTSNSPYPYSVYPPYPPMPPLSSAVGGASSSGTGTITDEHIRASLMSAVEDKLKRRMREQFQQHQAELETLRRTHQELVQGKAKLDEILGRLEREQVILIDIILSNGSFKYFLIFL